MSLAVGVRRTALLITFAGLPFMTRFDIQFARPGYQLHSRRAEDVTLCFTITCNHFFLTRGKDTPRLDA